MTLRRLSNGKEGHNGGGGRCQYVRGRLMPLCLSIGEGREAMLSPRLRRVVVVENDGEGGDDDEDGDDDDGSL